MDPLGGFTAGATTGAMLILSALVGAVGFSPFSNASVPSGVMVAYAGVYLAVALALALTALVWAGWIKRIPW